MLGRLATTVSLALTLGCASYSSMKEARTVDRGQLRIDVAPAATTARPASGATAFLGGRRPVSGDTTEQARTLPGLEAQVRYGVAPGLDLGVKTSLTGIELNATAQLVRGEGFDLALAPAVQGALGSNGDDEGWQMVLAKVAVLGDLRFGAAGRHALVLGPAVAKAWGSGTSKNSGYPVDALFAGGTLGVSLELARGFRVFPEIAIYTPLHGSGVALPGHVVRVSPDVARGTPVLLEMTLGFSFGGGAP